MERLYKNILRFRWLIIAAVAAATVFLAIQIPGIRINSDVVSSLPDDDPNAFLLKKIGTTYGGNRTGMIILEADNIFTPETIEHIRQVTDMLSATEGVSSVTSLTTAMSFTGDENGMEVAPLVDPDNMPSKAEEFTALRDKVLADSKYRGSIISDDGTAAVIIFTMYDEADLRTLADQVKEKTAEMGLPEKVYYAGSPMMITSIAHMISSDLTRLLPIAFVLIILVLYAGFRSARGVIIPLLTAVLAIIWTIGIMALSGAEISMVTNNIPIILLAVGTAYAIHVINRIDQASEKGDGAVITAMAYVFIPVILAALTTITGFASFIVGSYLTMIRDFGLFTALGTLIALLLSLFFVPALISATGWTAGRSNKGGGDEKARRLPAFFSGPLHTLLYNHPKYIVIFWTALTIAFTGGVFLVKRSVDVRNYFRKDNPTRVAEEIMNAKFGGTKPVFLVFSGDVQDPAFLNLMLSAEEFMKRDSGIVATQSVADLISEMNGALTGVRAIPEEREAVEQMWFFLEGNESIGKLVSPDLDQAIIISRFAATGNREKERFRKAMEGFISDHSDEGYTIEMTGMPFIESTMDQSLVRSQVASLIIALVTVIIIVSLILRSLSSGLFAAVPVMSTILMLFGIMGFTGIPLNIATVLVASIAAGIGIDYSIHVITHFNSSVKAGASIFGALEETIGISGKAIIINVVSVSAGFLVLLFSEMVPLQYFGLLIFLSMAGAGLSALTFLPAILIIARRRREKN